MRKLLKAGRKKTDTISCLKTAVDHSHEEKKVNFGKAISKMGRRTMKEGCILRWKSVQGVWTTGKPIRSSDTQQSHKWGCFNYNGLGELISVNGIMNSDQYINILSRELISFMKT